jgi:meso-butanediol dehydrogenase/(S,S)-butanediol dehydrogenase/diacetyl reductase
VLTEVGLRGAVVIVTGAGSGIGAATARQLGTVGARVVLVGRREALLTDVAAEIAEAGGDALSVPADLADQASPRRIVDACLNHYNRLDGLVNNAAVVRHMPVADWDVGCFDEHLATNVRAPKSALDYLTKTLAGELAPLGVRVNGIAPGPIDTPIHATWADDLDEAYRWLAGQVPLGRIGTPAEVATWITLLLSPLASFMTGAVIPLDGGQVIDRE